MSKDCTSCRNCGWDPDGLYCGHPEALNTTPYGMGLQWARGTDEKSFCGPEAKYYDHFPPEERFGHVNK